MILPGNRFMTGRVTQKVVVVCGEDEGTSLLKVLDRVQSGRSALARFETANGMVKPCTVVGTVGCAQ